MDEGDREEVAHRALQTLVDVIYIVSNLEFQRAVWDRGDYQAHYVSNHDETVEMFQENLGWLIGDGFWRYTGIIKQASLRPDFFIHESNRSITESAVERPRR